MTRVSWIFSGIRVQIGIFLRIIIGLLSWIFIFIPPRIVITGIVVISVPVVIFILASIFFFLPLVIGIVVLPQLIEISVFGRVLILGFLVSFFIRIHDVMFYRFSLKLPSVGQCG